MDISGMLIYKKKTGNITLKMFIILALSDSNETDKRNVQKARKTAV